MNIREKDFAPSINDDDLLDRIKGSMFGMTIGDALGAHVEFRPRTYLEAHPVKDLQGGGTWGLAIGQVINHTLLSIVFLYISKENTKYLKLRDDYHNLEVQIYSNPEVIISSFA